MAGQNALVEDPATVRRILAKRLFLAGLMIIILLSVLAVFDYLSKTGGEDELSEQGSISTTPGPSIVSSSRSDADVTDPVLPTIEPPGMPIIEAQPTVYSVSSAQDLKELPEEAQSVLQEAGSGSDEAPVADVARVPERSAAPVRVLPPSPQTAIDASASVSSSGYVLQAGVFSSPERARKLKARLIAAGVPVTIESRVHVGPFSSQKDADAARSKIKALGIDSLLIPPRRH